MIFPSKKPKWLNPRPPQCLSFAQTDLLCMHRPSVQFLDCKTRPSQSLPPFLGAGAAHSLLRQCVHSVPQVDHLLHEVHLPSTATQKPASGQRHKELFEGREEQSTSRKKTPPNTEENAPPRNTAFILTAEVLHALHTLCVGSSNLPYEVCDYFFTDQANGSLTGHTETKAVTRSCINVNPGDDPFSIKGETSGFWIEN